uniref:uncharacterized protein LOC101292186 isoform X2 n=1 Tax=Fragaria vesca subsp. vesca TaxID=101020 RepID=UPI0005C972C8|nr:PREDICTED: uncharacterized protein LOC101292186 isoform X2 [Fragaria vesca subsp. vesca]
MKLQMDSILNSSLEQICSEGPNGLLLQTLSSRLNLSPPLQQPLWAALLSIPSLKFHTQNQNATVSHLPTDPSIQSFRDAENLNLKLVADQPLRNNFLGLYDVRSAADAMCAYQRKTLERVAAAGSKGITQSQLSKELGIRGENFFYKLRRLECQGLVVKKCLDDTNLVCLNRYAKHLGLGFEPQRVEVSKCEGEESESKKSGGDFTAELPIEHQIYEMVNEAGSRGVIVFKVAERLGIDRKENRKRIESLCSKFGMIMDKEKCGKTQVYRVWAPGKRNAESANEIQNESECVGRSKFTEDVLDGSVQKGDTAMATATNDVSSGMPPAAECARPRRGKGVLEPSQDKGDQLQSQGFKSPLQKRKRSSEAASIEFIEVDGITEHQPGSNEDGEEGCAFSKSKSPRFLWTEEADRQLVIQYVRRCATLGAKYHHHINWSSLPDLPAPASTCKRRMSYLKISNGKFRKSLMRLCNMLSKRYAKLRQKSQNRSFNQDDCGSLFQDSTEEGCNQNYPLSDHGTGLQEEPWDHFNDKNIKEVLEEILHYVRSTKSVASKTYGASCREGSDLNANAEEDVFPNICKSPFPTDSGKRAAKFAHWLHKRDRDLLGRGIDLPTEIQCGDLFHLFALVSSGELSISPCLPDGVREAEDLRSSKQKIGRNEHLNAKRLKSLVAESEIISRREKGFPGLMVSVYRPASSKLDCDDLFKDEEHFGGNHQDSSAQNQIREILNPGIVTPVTENCRESPDKGILHPGSCYIGGAPNVNDAHILISPKEVAACPSEKLTNSVEGKDISPRRDFDKYSRCSSDNSFAPRLPWINVDGTINKTMYEGLSRRVFGIVMQNPGILEGELIHKMDGLSLQSCKKLLAEMIEAKYLHIRTMRQATTNGPPAFLGTLSGTSLTHSKVVFCKHLFANSMNSFLL